MRAHRAIFGQYFGPHPERTTSLSAFRDGSVSVRVRVNFGWPKPLTRLGFKNVVTQNNGPFRITELTEFRDRLGRRLDRENAKIIPLRIFNLLANKPSVTLTHNPSVGGSSPPGPTIFSLWNLSLAPIFGRDPWTISPQVATKHAVFGHFLPAKIPGLTKLFSSPRWHS